MNIYCTYFTIYLGSKLPAFYIGSTSLIKIHKNYHGSVLSKKYKSIWKTELKSHPELFITKILRTFKTRQEAFNSEEKLQKFLKVVPSNTYINEAYANNSFNNAGKIPINKGVPMTSEQRKKISDTRTGMKFGPLTTEHKLNCSKSKLGELNPMYGKPSPYKGIPQQMYICPHCEKPVSAGNMKRWHGNKCKSKT